MPKSNLFLVEVVEISNTTAFLIRNKDGQLVQSTFDPEVVGKILLAPTITLEEVSNLEKSPTHGQNS